MTWRLELFFKTPQDLQRQLPFLTALSARSLISGVNLTNKSKDDNLLASVKMIKAQLPSLDICMHYALRYNYAGGPRGGQARLVAFCQELEAISGCSMLLVSGSGEKRPLNTVTALQSLAQARPIVIRDLPLFVAFNPYLPDGTQAAAERDRLRAKLTTDPGRIAGVYLQMGNDIAALESGLDYMHGLFKEAYPDAAQQPQCYGSIFVPTRKLLAQMRFRPWNGVFLSEEYLSGVEAAEAVTAQVLEVYARRGVEPLVESAIVNEEQLDHAQRLLEKFTSRQVPDKRQ